LQLDHISFQPPLRDLSVYPEVTGHFLLAVAEELEKSNNVFPARLMMPTPTYRHTSDAGIRQTDGNTNSSDHNTRSNKGYLQYQHRTPSTFLRPDIRRIPTTVSSFILHPLLSADLITQNALSTIWLAYIEREKNNRIHVVPGIRENPPHPTTVLFGWR
jgi:hypothetical protein